MNDGDVRPDAPPRRLDQAERAIALQSLFQGAQNDLATFVALAFSVVEPGTDYLPNWHIRALCRALERVATG